MTQLELMMMHRRIFRLTDNLHDLCCTGLKDYRESLANVEDYNKTKILSRKCAVPDKNGDIRKGRVYCDIMHATQMDIEMFNYVDITMRLYHAGQLSRDSLKEELPILKARDTNPKLVYGHKINAGD